VNILIDILNNKGGRVDDNDMQYTNQREFKFKM